MLYVYLKEQIFIPGMLSTKSAIFLSEASTRLCSFDLQNWTVMTISRYRDRDENRTLLSLVVQNISFNSQLTSKSGILFIILKYFFFFKTDTYLTKRFGVFIL